MRIARSLRPGVVGLALAACTTTAPMTDPGHLEVWNKLRDDLAAVIGGHVYRIPACNVFAADGVELRGVIIATPSGIQLAGFDDASTGSIGPRRFLVIGIDGLDRSRVSDLRTRPSWEPPSGRGCEMTLEEFLRPGGNDESG